MSAFQQMLNDWDGLGWRAQEQALRRWEGGQADLSLDVVEMIRESAIRYRFIHPDLDELVGRADLWLADLDDVGPLSRVMGMGELFCGGEALPYCHPGSRPCRVSVGA